MSTSRRAFVAASLGAVAAGAARVTSEGPEATGTLGVIAAEPADAVHAGARLLAAGGNAFDALAAACLVACMEDPQAVDLGGYVAGAIVLEGKTGRVWSLDSDSVSPAAARPDMYKVLPVSGTGLNENEYQCSVEGNVNVDGPLAVGVPGTMAGIGTLWQKWGRAKWADVVAPAREVLDRGFAVNSTVVAGVKSREAVIRGMAPAKEHLMPDGRVPKVGDIWHRPGMDKTLARIAQAGWRDFYDGELGRKIADYVSGQGGILTRQDMARFQPRVTEAYGTSYRGARVFGAILPNGGLTVIEALNMLECFEPVAASDPRYWHRLTEVLKLAWRDRLTYLGDPAFAKVPVERLLDKGYAAGRVELLRQYPEYVDKLPAAAAKASTGTVNLSAVDAEGNMAAITISHGGSFGSCVTVPGTGITLGHGMCRFNPRPGLPNSVAAGKRPLNNVCPTLIRAGDRDVAIGMRGGRRIVSVVTTMVHAMLEHGASGLAAVTQARVHLEGQEPVEVTRSLDGNVVARLRDMGHTVKEAAAIGGNANVVERSKAGALKGAGNVLAVGVS